MTNQPDGLWDLDLRIEPERERPMPRGLTGVTTTSRHPPCPSTDPEVCVSFTCPVYEAFR